MPRGGARPGAGRPRKQKDAAAAPSRAVKPKEGRGLTKSDGEKAPEAPGNWPFGTTPPAPPPAAEVPPDPDNDDGLTEAQRLGLSPLDYLLAVMRSSKSSKSARMQAAIQAAPYMHAKPAPSGKKEGQQKDAEKASKGRFAPKAPPRLVVNNGG